MIRVSPSWLALREQADADARSTELADLVAARLRTFGGQVVVRDLGCGTGSMARWLAPRLPGPQRWIMQDRDADLLGMLDVPGVVVPTVGDVTELTAADLAETSLVTTSALLDILTQAEVDDIVTACVDARCPALFALSVTGIVQLTPSDPLDAYVSSAFNAHQRRVAGERALLGPDAVDRTVDAFSSRGAVVFTQPSPWRLDVTDVQLAVAWLNGWVAAAAEQQPSLPVDDYLELRLAQCAAGRLQVTVQHSDLLALPGDSA